MINKEALLGRLLSLHEKYFFIRCPSEQEMFTATAEFHSQSQQYLQDHFMRSLGRESHEYVYFIVTEQLTKELWMSLQQQASSDGVSRIHANRQHMFTDITLIILAESIMSGVPQDIHSTTNSKSFHLGMWGSAEFRCYVVDCSSGQSYANRQGRQVKSKFDTLALLPLLEAFPGSAGRAR